MTEDEIVELMAKARWSGAERSSAKFGKQAPAPPSPMTGASPVTQDEEQVPKPRYHVEGQTSTVGARWLIWDGTDGHFARFQHIADKGDAVALCDTLNAQETRITALLKERAVYRSWLDKDQLAAIDAALKASEQEKS